MLSNHNDRVVDSQISVSTLSEASNHWVNFLGICMLEYIPLFVHLRELLSLNDGWFVFSMAFCSCK